MGRDVKRPAMKLRTLSLALICACGNPEDGWFNKDAGRKPVEVEHAPSCTVTFRIEDLNEMYARCSEWNKNLYFYIGEPEPRWYYWCSHWAR